MDAVSDAQNQAYPPSWTEVFGEDLGPSMITDDPHAAAPRSSAMTMAKRRQQRVTDHGAGLRRGRGTAQLLAGDRPVLVNGHVLLPFAGKLGPHNWATERINRGVE